MSMSDSPKEADAGRSKSSAEAAQANGELSTAVVPESVPVPQTQRQPAQLPTEQQLQHTATAPPTGIAFVFDEHGEFVVPAPVRDFADDGQSRKDVLFGRVAAPHRPEHRRRQIRRWGLAATLFIATACTMFLAGLQLTRWPVGELLPREAIDAGLTYAGSLLLILLFHEFGHYLVSRWYGVEASPPMFLPMPVGEFGTMGAVIIQRGRDVNRRMLFDIAIAGPLAGLAIALPVAWYGAQQAEVVPVNAFVSAKAFGDPLVLRWMYEWTHPELVAGQDVYLNPLLFAGWVGLFITALNLMPIGQLDGGHILYALIGRRAHWVAIALMALAVVYMIQNQYPVFALMVLLLFFMGIRHPPTADDQISLGWPRVILGWLTLSFLIVGFTPEPIVLRSSPVEMWEMPVKPIIQPGPDDMLI